MNKKVNLCDIEALREGTNDKYGVSATLVFNKGLTYKELEQVINEKYFYLSNNNLQIDEDTPKEDKKIEKLNINTYDEILDTTLASKINEIIDRLNGDNNDKYN